jgi:hypothetical protein
VDVHVLVGINHAGEVGTVPFGSTESEAELGIDELVVTVKVALDVNKVFGSFENVKVLLVFVVKKCANTKSSHG